MGIDNAIIDVRGPEIPVMDGSAKVFADAFAAIGLMTQPLPRRTFAPDRTHVFRDGDRLLIVMPAPAFRVRMTVDFDPPIGLQYRDLAIDPASYAAGVAPNRTFGFAHEVEALIRRGLAQGGTLENAVVFGPDGPLSELRAADEPCRHKILDLIGDFALLGAYPQCEVVAIKSGHALHCAAVRELSAHSTGLLAPAVLP
jgi:UDP-3-O-[3-hydroxymyristoyl] N-acetylglucosamine deacetylase